VLISHQDSAPVANGILPLLTTSAQLLHLASESLASWLASRVPSLKGGEAVDTADALVRLTVSHLALPALSREEAATKITEVGLRYLGLSSPERIASA